MELRVRFARSLLKLDMSWTVSPVAVRMPASSLLAPSERAVGATGSSRRR